MTGLHARTTVRAPKPSTEFYDFDDYERLLDVAKGFGPTAHLVALLGGEAGLRCGEMIGLEWGDVDLVKRQMCIQRSEWRGHVTVPKGGSIAIRADDRTARSGAPGPSSPEEQTRALSGRWLAAYAGRRGRVRSEGRAQSRSSGQWSTSTASHVAFASRHERCAGTGDSGDRRTSRPQDDSAVHTPESISGRECNPAAGAAESGHGRTPRRGKSGGVEKCWRRVSCDQVSPQQ
jgi:hypothetical protein